MNNPSLTPYSDSMEIGIKKMMESLDVNSKDPQYDQVAARTALACLPVMLRSFGTELDMRTDPSKIIAGFSCTIANFMASLVATVVENDGRHAGAIHMLSLVAQDVIVRLNPERLPSDSHTHVEFDFTKEGTA